MIGQEAWWSWETVRSVVTAATYGGRGLMVAKEPTPGRQAMLTARFGLSVYPCEKPIYPRDPRRRTPR